VAFDNHVADRLDPAGAPGHFIGSRLPLQHLADHRPLLFQLLQRRLELPLAEGV
jgi:hypothetical protein